MTENRLPRLAELPDFTAYMSTDWGVPDRRPPVVDGAAAAAAQHRRRLVEALAAYGPIVVAAGRAPVRANDSYYDFRADSDFYWLTGCRHVEDAVLVLDGASAVLYLPPPAYPGDPGFFSDAAHGELWVGAAPGLDDWAKALDLEVRPLTDTVAHLSTMPKSPKLSRTLSELRMIKDAWEIQQLRSAVDKTVDGFARVVAEFGTAVRHGGERWLQGTFDRHARTVGNGPGYATIVGSGKHAPTLHWVRCDGPVVEDELVLLDMGVEENSLYTADVTRTFPASGRFSDAQRQVHDLVEKSHRAGLAAVAPGRTYSDFHHAAMEVIAHGLADWGLLPVSVDEALSPTGQHHRRWLVCGIGHHLGLDVHDCSTATYDAYQGAEMRSGMVLTVEPGLYFHAHDESVPPELRGIGARIEDDVLVTDDGADVLSDELPLSASGLEDWMAAPAGR